MMERHEELGFLMHMDTIDPASATRSIGKELEEENSPLVFQKPGKEVAIVRRAEQDSIPRRETHFEEPQEVEGPKTQRNVPNGLSSALFRPLWMAVFSPKKLPKRTIIGADLERLCIALLTASRIEDKPFLTVGYHVKGLCIILAQKLKFLSEDMSAISKKLLLVATPAAIAGPPKQRRSYREADDDDYEGPKRRKGTRKQRKTKKRMLAVEDYYESGGEFNSEGYGEELDLSNMETARPYEQHDNDGDYLPMDQIEILQLMNFGIGLGVGTDLAFYSAGKTAREPGISYHNFEHGVVERPVMSLETLHQNRDTINSSSYLDVNSLSSPFKINGYSFTPQAWHNGNMSEADTTIASTEATMHSGSVELNSPEFRKYDLDWDIYNDPFEEDDMFASDARITRGGAIVPAKRRKRRMVLEYTEKGGKTVHLVKSRGVGRYDASIMGGATKTPRKVKLPRDQTTLDTYMVSPQVACDKRDLFNNAIDSLLRSVIGRMPTEDEGAAAPAIEDEYVETFEFAAPSIPDTPTSQISINEHSETWMKLAEKNAEGNRKSYSPSHTFDKETMNTVQVIEAYRALLHDAGPGDSIDFSRVVKGRSKENTALIFYRTLVLANADFISLSQDKLPGSAIEVAPSRRFWEPIQTSRDIKA